MKLALALGALILSGGLSLAVWGGNSFAAEARHDAAQHRGQDERPGLHGSPGTAPRQAGQASFAAIQEIVAILEADPATDWSAVDIERLRRHLVDMDNVMMGSRIETSPIPGGARFTATGSGGSIGSIQRMIEGHAWAMNGESDWRFVSRLGPQGGALDVTSPMPGDEVKIRALGLAGLLSRGSHHQPHHLAMAAGRRAHQ